MRSTAQEGTPSSQPSDGATHSVASAEWFLTGELIHFGGCSGPRWEKVEDSFDVVVDHVLGARSDDLVACLEQATVSMERGAFPELILDQLRRNVPTNVICDDLPPGVNASAEPNTGGELFTLDNGFLDGNTDGRVASVMLHEIMHNRGYHHPNLMTAASPTIPAATNQEYKYTLPEQVEQCSLSISNNNTLPLPRGTVFVPNGNPRANTSALHKGRMEPHPIGGLGGLPFSEQCGAGRFSVGFDSRSGSKVDGIALRCAAMGLTGWTSSVATQPYHGGSGGILGTLQCPVGSAMVGVRGRAGDEVDAISPVCETLNTLFAIDHAPDRSLQPVGGGGGVAVERLCPAGFAVGGIRGRSGNRLDQLRLECVRINDSRDFSRTSLAQIGSFSGLVREALCPNDGAIRSFWGKQDSDIGRLGGECVGLTRNASGTLVPNGETEIALPSVGEIGQNDVAGFGDPVFDACPSGAAVIGFDYFVNIGVDFIQGRCQPITLWDAGSAGASTLSMLVPRGTANGPTQTLECPEGYFMVGWTATDTGAGVTSLQPQCRNFPGEPTPSCSTIDAPGTLRTVAGALLMLLCARLMSGRRRSLN